MSNIKIITDAGADLTKRQQEEYNIEVLPLRIYADGKEYLAGVDTFSEDFYALLKTLKEFPKTSQPSTAEIYDMFKKYTDENIPILMITLSSKASGLNNNANLAKNMILEENSSAVIEIIDSERYSFTYGLAVIEAAKMAESGASMEEIINKCTELMESFTAYFIPSTLEYLEKGGRINKASLVFGNMLDIVPVLSLVDGMVSAVGKVRGRKKIAKKIFDYAVSHHPETKGDVFYIPNGDLDAEANEIKALIEEKFPESEIIEYKVGPIIAAHIGPVCGIYIRTK